MSFASSNEKILLEILKNAEIECGKIQDEGLKENLSAKLYDAVKIVLNNIEREQGLAVLYLMSTNEIETNVLNPFKDLVLTKKDK